MALLDSQESDVGAMALAPKILSSQKTTLDIVTY